MASAMTGVGIGAFLVVAVGASWALVQITTAPFEEAGDLAFLRTLALSAAVAMLALCRTLEPARRSLAFAAAGLAGTATMVLPFAPLFLLMGVAGATRAALRRDTDALARACLLMPLAALVIFIAQWQVALAVAGQDYRPPSAGPSGYDMTAPVLAALSATAWILFGVLGGTRLVQTLRKPRQATFA